MKYTKEGLYCLFADLDIINCLSPIPNKLQELIDYILKLQEENSKQKELSTKINNNELNYIYEIVNNTKITREECNKLSEQSLEEIFNLIANRDFTILNYMNKEADLIKYLEDKIKFFEDKIDKLDIKNIYAHFDIAEMYRNKIKIYQDILERLKNNNYEN